MSLGPLLLSTFAGDCFTSSNVTSRDTDPLANVIRVSLRVGISSNYHFSPLSLDIFGLKVLDKVHALQNPETPAELGSEI